ncbi:hypothetical protein ABPG73_022891 [Tetrahymena malaccensis]
MQKEQQNILSEKQNNLGQNKIILSQNLLSSENNDENGNQEEQKIQIIKDSQKSEQENWVKDFFSFDRTVANQIKGKVNKLAQYKEFLNRPSKMFNQNKRQKILVSYKSAQQQEECQMLIKNEQEQMPDNIQGLKNENNEQIQSLQQLQDKLNTPEGRLEFIDRIRVYLQKMTAHIQRILFQQKINDKKYQELLSLFEKIQGQIESSINQTDKISEQFQKILGEIKGVLEQLKQLLEQVDIQFEQINSNIIQINLLLDQHSYLQEKIFTYLNETYTISRRVKQGLKQPQQSLEKIQETISILQNRPNTLGEQLKYMLEQLRNITQSKNIPDQHEQKMFDQLEKIIEQIRESLEQPETMTNQLKKLLKLPKNILQYLDKMLDQIKNRQQQQKDDLRFQQIKNSLLQAINLLDQRNKEKQKMVETSNKKTSQIDEQQQKIIQSQSGDNGGKNINEGISNSKNDSVVQCTEQEKLKEQLQDSVKFSEFSKDQQENMIHNFSNPTFEEFITIHNQIKEYTFDDYVQPCEIENEDGQEQYLILKRHWEKEIFYEQNTFQEQRKYVLENLQVGENQIYLCKNIITKRKEDLFIGYIDYQIQGYQQDLLIQIKYNCTEEALQKDILVLEALSISYGYIQIEQNNTHVLYLSLEDCIQIHYKLHQFIQNLAPSFNFSKLMYGLQINFEEFQKQQELQSIKVSIDFLKCFFKEQDYYLCEFSHLENKGIMVQESNVQYIFDSLQIFILNTIFKIQIKLKPNFGNILPRSPIDENLPLTDFYFSIKETYYNKLDTDDSIIDTQIFNRIEVSSQKLQNQDFFLIGGKNHYQSVFVEYESQLEKYFDIPITQEILIQYCQNILAIEKKKPQSQIISEFNKNHVDIHGIISIQNKLGTILLESGQPNNALELFNDSLNMIKPFYDQICQKCKSTNNDMKNDRYSEINLHDQLRGFQEFANLINLKMNFCLNKICVCYIDLSLNLKTIMEQLYYQKIYPESCYYLGLCYLTKGDYGGIPQKGSGYILPDKAPIVETPIQTKNQDILLRAKALNSQGIFNHLFFYTQMIMIYDKLNKTLQDDYSKEMDNQLEIYKDFMNIMDTEYLNS